MILSVNVFEGIPQDRQMTTGLHTVRDIFCVECQSTVGWRYVNRTSPMKLTFSGQSL